MIMRGNLGNSGSELTLSSISSGTKGEAIVEEALDPWISESSLILKQEANTRIVRSLAGSPVDGKNITVLRIDRRH